MADLTAENALADFDRFFARWDQPATPSETPTIQRQEDVSVRSHALHQIIKQKSADLAFTAIQEANPTFDSADTYKAYLKTDIGFKKDKSIGPRIVLPRFLSKKELATVDTKCRFITGQSRKPERLANRMAAKRVISWCILDPREVDTETCTAVQLCFDVDEVKEWMSRPENNCAKPSDTLLQECTNLANEPNECKQGTECKMFGADTIRSIVKEKGLGDVIVVPDSMPMEFREAVENFDFIEKSKDAIKTDPLGPIIQQALENWIASAMEKLERGANSVHAAAERLPGFGTFWWFTRKALTPFYTFTKGVFRATWKFSWWVSRNPFYMMIAATALRALRVCYCVYTTFPTLGPDLIWRVIDSIVGDLKKSGHSMLAFMVNFLTALMECTVDFLTQDYISLVANCLTRVVRTSSEWLKTAVDTVSQFMQKSFKWILERAGFPTFARFSSQIYTLSSTVISALWVGDPEEAMAMDLKLIFKNFTLRDWTETSVIWAIANFPQGMLTNLVVNLLTRISPPLLPVVAKMNALGLHPVVMVQYLYSAPFYAAYAKEYLDELYAWIFQMIPCVFGYMTKLIKYYFGMESAFALKGPQETLPCCMLRIIDDLQKYVKGESPAQQLHWLINNKFSKDRREATVEALQVQSEVGDQKLQEAVDWLNPAVRPVSNAELQLAIDDNAFVYGMSDEFFDQRLENALPGTSPNVEANPFQPQGLPVSPLEQPQVEDLGIIANAGKLASDYWKKAWGNYQLTSSDYKDYFTREAGRAQFRPTAETPSMLSLPNTRIVLPAVSTSDSHKLFDAPVFTIVVGEKPVHIYLFETRTDGLQGLFLHAGVDSREMESLFPGSVQTFKGKDYVLLHRLPAKVVRTLIEARSLIVNFGDQVS